MTDAECLDMEEIERITNAAQPGPWVPKYLKTVYTGGEAEHEVRSRETGCVVAALRFRPGGPEIGDDQADLDALFIARSREWVPVLVAEVKRLRAENLEFIKQEFAALKAEERVEDIQEGEREACAKVAESIVFETGTWGTPQMDAMLEQLKRDIAAAIRARGR